MPVSAATELAPGVPDTLVPEVASLGGDLESPAFESLVRLYRPRIFRFALGSLRDVDAAEMVTQDCFLRAYQARERFRQECSLQTWLMRIAANLIRDHARNRRLQFWKRASRTAQPADVAAHVIADGGRSPEEQALLREQVAAIWKSADRLPRKQRMVFLLRFVEDMELLEIAAVADMKEGTVKTHLFRALRTVRADLGGGK